MKQERHSQAVSSSCGLVLLDSLHFNKWKRVCSCKYRTVQQVSLTLSFGVTKVSYYSWVVLSLVKKTNMVPTSTRGPSLVSGKWQSCLQCGYSASSHYTGKRETSQVIYRNMCKQKQKQFLLYDNKTSVLGWSQQPGQADSVVVVYFGFCYPVFPALSVFGVRAHFENRSAVSSSLTMC